MVMLGLVCIWHTILPSISSKVHANADDWALIGLASFYVLAQLLFSLLIYMKVRIIYDLFTLFEYSRILNWLMGRWIPSPFLLASLLHRRRKRCSVGGQR